MQRIAASEIIEKDTPFVPEYPRRSLRNDHAAHFGILTPFGRNLQDIEDLHFSLRFNLEEKCWDLVSSNLQDADPPKHDRVLQLIRDFTKEKEKWKGTAAELLVELKNRDPGLDLTANVLIRIMNANSVMLRNFYKVSYHSLPKRNNMKRFSLRYLLDIVVENAVNADPSDTSDMSDNIGHFALIELTGSTETN